MGEVSIAGWTVVVSSQSFSCSFIINSLSIHLCNWVRTFARLGSIFSQLLSLAWEHGQWRMLRRVPFWFGDMTYLNDKGINQRNRFKYNCNEGISEANLAYAANDVLLFMLSGSDSLGAS